MKRRTRADAGAAELEDLPGADLTLRGLADLAAGRDTAEAILVEVARNRLAALGLTTERFAPHSPHDEAAELRLYARLAARHPERDPYPIYSAWLEQLDSFLWALTALRHREGAQR